MEAWTPCRLGCQLPPSEILRARYQNRLPTALDDLTGPAHGTVLLPLHVAWSGQTAFNLDQPKPCMHMYRIVLAEGHFGTLAEINLQRAFGFADGTTMDFAIRGVDVDCKFSQNPGDWMIPPEAAGQLVFGLWASDDQGQWSAGLIRATDEVLTSAAGNRDRKRWLSPLGKASATWLYKNKPLPENALLRLPPNEVQQIFACSAFGGKRLDMLFRLAQQRIISRTVVATVAQQEDYTRRVRGNGGSRESLRPEGIVIFGDYNRHRFVAEQLRLPVPTPKSGESVSARLARQREHHEGLPFVTLGGERSVVAQPSDPAGSAPLLPDTKA
jgi:hypothetical protein